MKNLQKLQPFIVALAVSVILGVAFAQELPPNETGRELLLLRNGQILEGRITKIRDQYLVDLPDGEIHVPAAETDFVCRSLEEGFQRKRAVIQASNWRDHLELARWCLKNDLNEHAAAELATAEAASPNNPLVAMLRRQMEPEPEPEPEAKREKTATYEDSVSNEELDRMVRGLPRGTVETFTQTVQPVLMNNCTSTGCHGPQSTNNLRLFRISTGQAANRRLTQRNLHTVLQYIDHENPAQSPLLTIPAAPHGTAKTAVYGEYRCGQYTRLALWVMSLDASQSFREAEILAHREPSRSLPTDSSLAQPTESEPGLLSGDVQKAKPLTAIKKPRGKSLLNTNDASSEVAPASYQEPPAEFLQSGHATVGKKKVSAEPPRLPPMLNQKVKRGAPLPQDGSKDPFDPEVFNRRYHKTIPPPEAVSQLQDSEDQKNSPDGG